MNDLQSQLFAKYKNNLSIFIETGSHSGSGIQSAIDCNFEHIHSIEIQPYYYNFCKKRFSNHLNVQLHLGDSSDILPVILSAIDVPVMLWLDGHYSCGNTGHGIDETPLLREIVCVSKAVKKGSVILIDDIRDWKDKDRIDLVTKKPIGFDLDILQEILKQTRNISTCLDTKRDDKQIFINDVLVIKF